MGGTKQKVHCGALNDAHLFHKVNRQNFEGVFEELTQGIFIPASVTRVVTLLKHEEGQLT